MAVNVVMPKWGLSMQKGRVLQWLKKAGDAVTEGEEIVEIESDKLTNVVEAPATGILGRIVVAAGDEAPITEVIAIIVAPGEAIPNLAGSAPAAPAVVSAEEAAPTTTRSSPPATRSIIKAMPVARKLAEEQGIDLSAVTGTGPNGAITKQDVEKAIAARASAPVAPATAGPLRAMPAARRIAKEQGIDLATVRGSGPNGIIVAADVERAASAPKAPATAPAPTVARNKTVQKVTFYSEGIKLDGMLYTPSGLAEGEQRPGVVLCVGYTYLKSLTMPDIAKVLTKAGYVALVFDYRGFGESEGPRWRLIPNEQVNDVRAALTYLGNVPHVKANELAVVGLSMGGSHAIAGAAQDQRVRAVVAMEAPGDGARWLRSLRRHYEWQEFTARVAADRVQRVQTGESTRVDPFDIVLPDPESQGFLQTVAQEFPQMKCDLPLESADALLEYSPQRVIAQISPRPVLLIHGPEDRLVPLTEAEQLYAAAREPKELLVIPGMGHFNWVLPNHPIFGQVTTSIVEFLQKHIG